MENLRYIFFKNSERKDNFNVEKFGHEHIVNWNHTNLILNWNKKDSDSIQVDLNHTHSNQPIPDDSINIVSSHDSDNICAIEKILASTVYYLVHSSRIFTYGSASEPPSPSHDSLV